MTIDLNRLSDELAGNPCVSDYDFWRAMKDLEYEIYSIGHSPSPVPIGLLHLREVVRRARRKRKARLE